MGDRINDGGPAFPQSDVSNYERGSATGYPFPDSGMSLRDWVAGQALPAIITAVCSGQHQSKYLSDGCNLQTALARDALDFADAMIAARTATHKDTQR